MIDSQEYIIPTQNTYKSIFILPLPIEIQILIFKHEHILKFQSVLNDIKNVCYICKCTIDENVPCFEIYIANLLVYIYYSHWSHKSLENYEYDRDIVKKVCNNFNGLFTIYYEKK